MRAQVVILAFALLVVLMGSAVAGSLAENKSLVEGFVSVGNSRELDCLGEYVSVDFVRHCQATPDLVITNLEQFKAFIEADTQVCPDSKVEVHQMVAEGDRVSLNLEAGDEGPQATAVHEAPPDSPGP